MIEKFQREDSSEKEFVFKKVDITLCWHEFLPASCWILSQLTAFVLKLQQKISLGQKFSVWKTALVPQYLLTRMLSTIFSCEYFRYFQ